MIKVVGWIDYDNFNFDSAEGSEEEINAVVEIIRENGYKFGGDDHENHSYCTPLLSNGKALRLSWRNWGYVMALAYDLKTKDGKDNYILWYMGEYGPEKRVFPKDEPIDLTLCQKGKTHEYELNEKEYHAIHNASFTSVVFPSSYFEEKNIKSLDLIAFKYQGKVILETMVNEIRFIYLSIDEFLTKDDALTYSENTNFRDFSKEEITTYIKDKYSTDAECLVISCLDLIDDNREGELIYV